MMMAKMEVVFIPVFTSIVKSLCGYLDYERYATLKTMRVKRVGGRRIEHTCPNRHLDRAKESSSL